METERKYLDKRAEDMTKKCFDGLFQMWDKMGSENLRKDKVDYILKNFEDILEIYIIIEKKDMEKMKKNIQELHHRRRELRKELGMDCAYTPTTPNSKSKFTFDYEEKRLETEVELLEEKKSNRWAIVKQVETKPRHYDTNTPESTTTKSSENLCTNFFTPMVKFTPESTTTESSENLSTNFFTPMVNSTPPKIYLTSTSPIASPLPANLSDRQKEYSRAMLCSKRLFNSPKLRRPSRS